MRIPNGSVLILFSCWLTLQAVCAQEAVRTTVPGNSPIEIPTSPFNDGSAIHEQEDRFKAEGRMIDYGVSVATLCKTSLSDFQTKLGQAIAANSFEAARKIVVVSEQTVAQAQAIDDRVFHFARHDDSPAGRAYTAADADLAAAKQTLKEMEAALLPVLRNEQAAQNDKLKAEFTRNADLQKLLSQFLSCNPDDPTAACNVFLAKAVKRAYGIDDFIQNPSGPGDPIYMVADIIAVTVRNNSRWTDLGPATHQDALDKGQQAANSNRAVLAVRFNNNGPGHVALLLPGMESSSGIWGLKAPNSACFFLKHPNKAYIGKSLAYAFTAPDGVELYARSSP